MSLDLDKAPPAVAELLQCSICLEQLSSPRTLLCQHSFCTHCLQRWTRRLARQRNGRDPKTLACPACRTPTPLNKDGIEGLPADFKVNKLAEFFQELAQAAAEEEKSKEKFLCDICKGQQGGEDPDGTVSKATGRAEKYCENCQEYLCGSCYEKHKSTAIFRNHHIVGAKRPIVFKPCQAHSHKLEKYFCVDCQVSACSSCVTNQHCDHDVTEIPTLLETRRQALTSVLDDVSERLERLRSSHVTRRAVTVVGNQYAQAEHAIRQHMRHIAHVLAQKEQSLLRDLRRRRDLVLATMTTEANKSHHNQSLMRSLQSYAAGMLESNCVSDVNDLLNHIQDVLGKDLQEMSVNLVDVKGIRFVAEVPELSIGRLEEVALPELGRQSLSSEEDCPNSEDDMLFTQTKNNQDVVTPKTSEDSEAGDNANVFVHATDPCGNSDRRFADQKMQDVEQSPAGPKLTKSPKPPQKKFQMHVASNDNSQQKVRAARTFRKRTTEIPKPLSSSCSGMEGFAALGGTGLGFLTGLPPPSVGCDTSMSPHTESWSTVQPAIQVQYPDSEDDDEEEFIQCAGKLEWMRTRPGKGPEHLGFPSDASFLSTGQLVVSDGANLRLQLLDKKGQLVHCIGAGSIHPMGVATLDDDVILVTDTKDNCLKMYSPKGRSVSTWSHMELQEPCGVAVSRDRKWVVTDKRKHTVFVFCQQGRCVGQFGGFGSGTDKFACPFYCTSDAMGRIIVSDNENHCVKIFDADGRFLRTVGKLGTGLGDMFYPHGVCVDRQNNIFVADCKNHRVSMFSPDGRFIQNVLTSEDSVAGPVGLAYTSGDSQDLLAITRCNKLHPSISVFRVVTL